jgi:hypothetical protein
MVWFYFVNILYINCNNKNSQNNWNDLMKFSHLNKPNNFETQTRYLKIIVKSSNISRECEKSIFHTIKALNLLEVWAFQMYNAWSKFPPTGRHRLRVKKIFNIRFNTNNINVSQMEINIFVDWFIFSIG